MKVVAINGSPRKDGNCAQMLEVLGKVLEGEGIEFEVCQPGAKVHPCMACYHCLDNGTLRCVQDDDGVNEIIAKCIEADGIVLASPVYHGGIAGGMKCVLDRLILAAGCGENQLHHKVGAALCTLRRSGGMETYQQLLGTINTMEMVLVTSDYWNAVHGADKGEVMQDTEGAAAAAFDRARGHDGRYVATETHDERNERLAVQSYAVHDPVHDEGCASQVARILHESDEQV